MGIWGKFHTYLLITLILSINSSGIFTWGFVFLELDPGMLCYLASDPETASYHKLLEIFATGTYMDYKGEKKFLLMCAKHFSVPPMIYSKALIFFEEKN